MIRVYGKIMGLLGQTDRHLAMEKAMRLLMVETAVYTTQELRDRMRSIPLERGETPQSVATMPVKTMVARIAASDVRKLAGARRIVAEADEVWHEFVGKSRAGNHFNMFGRYISTRVGVPELVTHRR